MSIFNFIFTVAFYVTRRTKLDPTCKLCYMSTKVIQLADQARGTNYAINCG
jgi:hypothetical protein